MAEKYDNFVIPAAGGSAFLFSRNILSGQTKKRTKSMRPRGIEPLAKPWKGFMLPLHHERLIEFWCDTRKHNVFFCFTSL